MSIIQKSLLILQGNTHQYNYIDIIQKLFNQYQNGLQDEISTHLIWFNCCIDI